jgi:hypothetical protein
MVTLVKHSLTVDGIHFLLYCEAVQVGGGVTTWTLNLGTDYQLPVMSALHSNSPPTTISYEAGWAP